MLNIGVQVIVSDEGRHFADAMEVQEMVNVCCTYEEPNR